VEVGKKMYSINISVFRAINDLGFHLTFLNPIMVFFAKYGVFLLALWMILFWFLAKEKVWARIVLVGSVVSFVFSEVIGKVLGKFIEHVQPFATLSNVNKLMTHEIDNSFPSDHAILVFSICTMLFLGSKSSKRVSFLIFATMIGFSRIWVGVHYPIDVLIGAFIGIFVSGIFYLIIKHSKIGVRKLHGKNEKNQYSQ
jgi:undecaprenyl-diphosphatase